MFSEVCYELRLSCEQVMMPYFKRCSTLEEELVEARKKLAELQEGRAPSPPTMEQDESSSEIIRLLNYVRNNPFHWAHADVP